jgi:hypothetical protein
VALANMLSLIGQDIQALSELGRRSATVEGIRGPKSKIGPTKSGLTGGVAPNLFAGLDEHDGRPGALAPLVGSSGMMV